MKIKDSIKEFIINNEVESALEFLNKLRIQKYDDIIINLIASFNEIKSIEIKGIVEYEVISRKRAGLRNRILQLASEIDKTRNKLNNNTEKCFELINGYEITSENLFGTKSNPQFGFNEKFYHQRDYLDIELRTSILFNQNILLTGETHSGKSRTILELIKRYLTKYSIVLPVINTKDISGFKDIKNKDNVLVVYDDINLFFKQNYKIHIEAIKEIVNSNKLSIIASCRSSEKQFVKETLDDTYSLFKNVEIQQLSKSDKKILSGVLK